MPKVIEVPAVWLRTVMNIASEFKYATTASTKEALEALNLSNREKLVRLIGYLEAGKDIIDMKEKDV